MRRIIILKEEPRMNNMYHAMNVFLADVSVLSMKVHNIHWNLKGNDFIPIHGELDDFYDELQEFIDESAERLLMIGDRPVGNLKEMLEMTRLHELPNEHITSTEGFTALIEDYNLLRTQALHIINLSEEANDPGSADLYTDMIRKIEKRLWIMTSYLS